MAEEDRAQKTEPATPRRREEARKKGQVAQSRELQSVVVLGTALLALVSPLGAVLLERLLAVLQTGLAAAASPPSSLAGFHALILGFATPIGLACIPVFAAIVVVAALTQLTQTGPLFSPEALAPRLDRISLIAGMKRMVDLDRLIELVKALFKVAMVGLVGWLAIGSRIDVLVGLASAQPRESVVVAGEMLLLLSIWIVSLLAVMAAFDLVYQRWRYEQRLRMSKREVRQELKQNEGDPHLRGRFRARHRELSRSRMIAAVAEADVVVANPTHYAVALRYDRAEMAAPEVIAKGRGHVAVRIREAARLNDVPIVENPPLARLLHRSCEVGREVPEKLFQAVAEVLAYVYRLDAARARRAQEARP